MSNDKRQLIIEVKAQVEAALASLKQLETDGAAVAGKLGTAFNFNMIMGAIDQVSAHLRPVVQFIEESISEAAQAEEVQAQLNALTAESVPLIQAYADAMQRRLGIDNDVFMGMAARIAAYTGLRGEELKMATQLAVQYGGLKGSMEGADKAVGRFLQGGQLKGLHLELSETADETERLTAALNATEGGMVLLDAHAATTKGHIDAFHTSVKNLKEAIGTGILESSTGEGYQAATAALTELNNKTNALSSAIANMIDLYSAFLNPLPALLGDVAELWHKIVPEVGNTREETEKLAKATAEHEKLLAEIEGHTEGTAKSTAKIVDEYDLWLQRLKSIAERDRQLNDAMAAAEERRKEFWRASEEFWAEHDRKAKERADAEKAAHEALWSSQRGLVELYDMLTDAGKRMFREQWPLIDEWKQRVLDMRPPIEKIREQYERLGLVSRDMVTSTEQTARAVASAHTEAEARLQTERQITRELEQQRAVLRGFVPFTTPKESTAFAAQARAAVQGGTADALMADLQQQLAQLNFEIAAGQYRGELPSLNGGAAGRLADLEAFIEILRTAQDAFGKRGTPAGTNADPIKVQIVGSSNESAIA